MASCARPAGVTGAGLKLGAALRQNYSSNVPASSSFPRARVPASALVRCEHEVVFQRAHDTRTDVTASCVTQRSGLPRGPDPCRDRADLVAPRAREVLCHGEAVGVGEVLVQFGDRVDAIDLDQKRSH
jgi:hypothetical protein